MNRITDGSDAEIGIAGARADSSVLATIAARAAEMDGKHYVYKQEGCFSEDQVGRAMARFFAPWPFAPNRKSIWLGRINWPFPTWIVYTRPFDWAEDEADIPIPDPLPPWEIPERRKMDFYLRPVRVVRR